MVDRSAREITKFHARGRDPGLTGSVWVANDSVRVGDVQIIAHEHYPKWRIQVLKKYCFLFRQPIAVRVPEQEDALPGLGARVRHLLHQVHDDLFRTVDWRRRSAGLDDQDIAVGQNVE